MSLKAFHIVFIVASTLLTLGFGGWSLRNYFAPDGRTLDLVLGALSLAACAALLVYGRYFLKKLKHISYL